MKIGKMLLSVLLTLAIILTSSGCSTQPSPESSNEPESAHEAINISENSTYETMLFDTGYVHMIDITISENDWTDLNANPTAKTKYETNVTIDGITIESVSFATKGNSSLSQVANDPESNRYSFKINFGKFVKGQTYYGLNKLNLNNIYADGTYMKDYISYEIFRQAGVDAPLTSYVWLTINGEDHGLYLAIEDISESYLDRTNDGKGVLYKPEAEGLDVVNGDAAQPKAGNAPVEPGNRPHGGGMPSGQLTMPEDGQMPSFPDVGSEESAVPGDWMPEAEPNLSSAANGADLKYTDDDIGSYSDIFDNNKTDADEEDQRRVILALKALSEKEDLDSYLDTEEIIRYFAAHIFVMNYDSYIGTMLHNYYLYENDGKLAMLPWDYNEAFGSFSRGKEQSDTTVLINTGIDTPLSCTTEDNRPMWSWIVSDDEYLEQYHAIFDKLIETFFESGKCAEDIDAVYEMILPYVEKDPTAFCTVDQFKTAVSTLKRFCELRSKSIRAQLDGTLATKTDEQNSANRIDASDININEMSANSVGGDMHTGRPGEGSQQTPDRP